MKLNILLIGSGGREHALALGLSKSESCGNLYAIPGNPGMFELAERFESDLSNFNQLVEDSKKHKINLIVVGPEQPLAEGLADIFRENSIAVFGPSKFAAQLESSKSFAKDLMKEYDVPTAKYASFDKEEIQSAKDFINQFERPPVIKADGLAGGKGVLIPNTFDEAKQFIEDVFSGKFGSAGDLIVIEEFMEGEEASVFAVCDGEDFITLAPSQDHKRAYDNDKGENTGGMGAYAPAKIVTEKVLNQVKKDIIKPVLRAIKEKGDSFIGCLYCGLMIKDEYARVVEFNVRFGDPETQSVLSIFEGDLAGLFYSAAIGKIDKANVKNIASAFACNVVLASEGYPAAYEKGKFITGLENAKENGAEIYHAGTKLKDGKLLTNGGRVIAVNYKADSLEKAIEGAYEAVNKICFDNIYYRNDIGKKGL